MTAPKKTPAPSLLTLSYDERLDKFGAALEKLLDRHGLGMVAGVATTQFQPQPGMSAFGLVPEIHFIDTKAQ